MNHNKSMIDIQEGYIILRGSYPVVISGLVSSMSHTLYKQNAVGRPLANI